ncbi:auxin-induced protein 15A [Cicer arietinum]|uniref:Auxin-induced protein 15A n=1 Tax=Cicer arietinum TaxID=3827 RepID=A0A1S2Y2R0_CICAR|nr:auxin-induced protein 15A [Cicer arietinum]
MVRSFVWKIQKGISHLVNKRHEDFSDEIIVAEPEDVREGYFVVVANKEGETKRFVIGLEFLSDPAFLGLLDQAREEYGFIYKGAIAVPCRPQELHDILDGR